MKHLLLLSLLTVSLLNLQAQKAEQVISGMIDALGGKTAFYQKGSVTYDYAYHSPSSKTTMTATETYVFDGELSHATYTTHTIVNPEGGPVEEGFDGSTAWSKINGQTTTNEQALNVARFMRKTNYYWFAMFFKLQDEGVNLEYQGTETVEGHHYDLVKVTFGNTVGDAQDTYVLYVNQRTKLVDQFLFTVMGFGKSTPSLMKLKYQTIDGIKIATERSYIDANWQGEVTGTQWTTTYWDNIRFSVQPAASLFGK